jgi:hypothetical protein
MAEENAQTYPMREDFCWQLASAFPSLAGPSVRLADERTSFQTELRLLRGYRTFVEIDGLISDTSPTEAIGL